jgi:endonuclease/exonuclease/phosphatase family metal-dependent hydrolase
MRLVTWNIQLARGVDGRVDLDRIVERARGIADFDVLCLQEVCAGFSELPGADASDQFAVLAERLPGYTAIEGVATDWPGTSERRRFGNMLFSRLPLGPVLRHLLPWPADPALTTMQRSAIEATVEAEFGPLRVITTHLEYYSALQRRAQVERLRLLHEEAFAHAARPRAGNRADGPFAAVLRAAPALLVGDFNFGPDSAEYARVQDPFGAGTPPLRDAWTVVHPGRPHAPTVGLYDKVQWPGPPVTFDFVFVSADLASRVHAMRVDTVADASDHQPVLVELR